MVSTHYLYICYNTPCGATNFINTQVSQHGYFWDMISFYTNCVYVTKTPAGVRNFIDTQVSQFGLSKYAACFALRANCGYLRHLFTGVYHLYIFGL